MMSVGVSVELSAKRSTCLYCFVFAVSGALIFGQASEY